MSRLTATALSCIRSDRILFDDLHFTLNDGELLHLSGPNGAGKTSLLRILTGLIQASSGNINYRGCNIDDDGRRLMNKELVFIGHKAGLNPLATAFENIRFWCDLHSIQVTTDEIFSVLATLGLVGLEEMPSAQLSAGQTRRVALASLWLKEDAKLWILDEPFTALDISGIELIESKMAQFLSSGGSIVMTSHQPLTRIKVTHHIALEYRI